VLAAPLQPDGEVDDDAEVRETDRERRAGHAQVQDEDEEDVEEQVRDGRADEPDHDLPGGALRSDELLEAERGGEHGDEGQQHPDVRARRGQRGGVRPEEPDERVQQEQRDAAHDRADDHRAPDGEGRDVPDLSRPLGRVLRRAQQPRDERAAADAEDPADRHDQPQHG
jgi:hypothetical protein